MFIFECHNEKVWLLASNFLALHARGSPTWVVFCTTQVAPQPFNCFYSTESSMFQQNIIICYYILFSTLPMHAQMGDVWLHSGRLTSPRGWPPPVQQESRGWYGRGDVLTARGSVQSLAGGKDSTSGIVLQKSKSFYRLLVMFSFVGLQNINAWFLSYA